MAKNLHLEHIEDMFLTGDENALNWLFANGGATSVKMDGAPAIVWGTNPENGKFFVGTKSVFNKKKIMICYSHEDIETHYHNKVDLAEILHECFAYLPRTSLVLQGDFIGFGGATTYTPNTITYVFNEVIGEDIIIAPHTIYEGEKMSEMNASPLHVELSPSENCKFVTPMVDMLPINKAAHYEDISDFFEKAKFLTEKEAKEVKIIINAFIREGKEITFDMLEVILEDYNLACLYRCVEMMKHDMIANMKIYDGPMAFIGEEQIHAEGFVRSNQFGTFKLVDRFEFAQANFNKGKFQQSA
jgi:hypothetical protein